MNVPFLGKSLLSPDVVALCDDDSPYVEKYPMSEMSLAFSNIADQCEQW